VIITRSPLRITLGGGGTDLPSYYQQFGGFLIAAAIDKYVYITIHDTFVDDLIVKYSSLERVPSADRLQHPIIREAMSLVEIHGRALEISSMADIPAGTGLGSSGSFTTALLKALHAHKKHLIHPRELAEQACHVEIDLLKEEIGKQDQYIAAFGGLTCLEFPPSSSGPSASSGSPGPQGDEVKATPLAIDTETLYNLEDNLLLFFTGYSRSASKVLSEQNQRSLQHDTDVERNLHELKEIAYASRDALVAGDLRRFGELLSVQWEQKKRRTGGASNDVIDQWYRLGMENGALGGKLVGAGGGGFLMFYAEDRIKLRHAMVGAGLREVRFRFDFEGTKVVIQ
jgi:D-glycero-alpha-D-manno-heptose-7-phosphate kinase